MHAGKMKIRHLFYVLLAVTACNTETLIEPISTEISLTATIKSNEVKAHVSDGVFSWTASDKISVWTTKGNFQTLSLYEGANSSNATFKGILDSDNAAMSTCAVYPAGRHSLDGDVITINLPSEYNLTNDILSVKMPMYAHLESDDRALFTPMGGLMSFTLINVPAGTVKIVFEAADRTVSGDFKANAADEIPVLNATELTDANTITLLISPSDEERNIKFYIPLPVGVYTGLKISLLNDNDEVLVSKETSKPNTVSRKSIVNMPTLDMTPGSLTNKQLYSRMVKDVTSRLNKYAYDADGNKLFTFAHASDIHPHGTNYDRNTEECIGFCNNNKELIDALLVTGDFCNGLQGRLVWWTTSEMDGALPILNKSLVPLYTLVGNHDDNINLTTGRPAVQTGINPKNAELYRIDKLEQHQLLIGPFLSKFTPEEANPDVCYYKIDYEEYKIRMIFLDATDCPMIFEDGYLKYIPGLFFDQVQLEWFYHALMATPDDYGVIVVCHGPFISGYERATYAQGADMIPSVIKAFKEASVYDHQWTYSQDSSISTSFNFDFSSRGKGDFICYLSGHIHYRRVGASYYKDQIVITAPALYETQLSEISRKGSSLDRSKDTTTINSFNLMTVDRANRKLYLTSFGAYEDESANISNRTETLLY